MNHTPFIRVLGASLKRSVFWGQNTLLERFGLLENRIDIQRDKNLNLVIDYLKNLKSEQRKRNPKEIRIPTIKQLSKTSSYRITNLGRDFLKSIASIENDN